MEISADSSFSALIFNLPSNSNYQATRELIVEPTISPTTSWTLLIKKTNTQLTKEYTVWTYFQGQPLQKISLTKQTRNDSNFFSKSIRLTLSWIMNSHLFDPVSNDVDLWFIGKGPTLSIGELKNARDIISRDILQQLSFFSGDDQAAKYL